MNDHDHSAHDPAGHSAHEHRGPEQGGHGHGQHARPPQQPDRAAPLVGNGPGRAKAGRGREQHVDHTGHEQMFRRRFWVSTLLSIPVLLYSRFIQRTLGFEMPAFPGSQWITPLFSAVVFAYGGVPFLQMAVPELRNRRPGMMMLISLAIILAFIYSLAALVIGGDTFFWELVTMVDIMLLGHWLEQRSLRQASGARQQLARLMPDTAERIGTDGEVQVVPASELRQGDLVLGRPGASVPAGGRVEQGESDVNEAMITGESRPVGKSPGEAVIVGTINGDGSLRVRVTATGDQTALAGIMRLVEQAQQSKSNTQILADKAAGWLFYLAIGVAARTAVARTAAAGSNVEVISRVATVLVIACPPALGLAIPLVVAITTRGEFGVVASAAVDRLHQMGVEVAMLTGDSRAVARAVGEELGIDQVFAEVLPEHKDQQVVELQRQSKRVAMVGEGLNDAPALIRADVGIAIGSGTDVAVESADIILVKSNPQDVVKIFALSRASYRKMIQNLLWATGYNLVALPLAAGVLAPVGILLWSALGAVFMSLSTVIMAINAQLLRRQEIGA